MAIKLTAHEKYNKILLFALEIKQTVSSYRCNIEVHLFVVFEHEPTSSDVISHGEMLHINTQLFHVLLRVTLQRRQEQHSSTGQSGTLFPDHLRSPSISKGQGGYSLLSARPL